MVTRTNKTKNTSKELKIDELVTSNTPKEYWGFLENCYKVIDDKKIASFNFTKSKELSVCINFLEIPITDSGVIAVAVSVMKNKKKQPKLNKIDFARTCSVIENRLLDLYTEDFGDVPYWISLKPYLLDIWYIRLQCHRLFFIPKESLLEVLESFTTKKFLRTLRDEGNLKEVAYYINTDYHHVKLVDLSDKE